MSAGSKAFTGELQAVVPGTKLRLKNGAAIEVTENPGDGIWLFCKSLDAAGDGERPLFLDEIAEYLE
ncbi:hypothetical protein [Aminobacter aminovorans]|uniref:hypothetical protein n=1 Tax=Aminobacter TaxID=31988 RepID=UPI002860E1B5|nr:hypothetical protein [Aminobacter aminovorans]MDR7225175.1 hypothetical protein [Aminobacter aminovorans]